MITLLRGVITVSLLFLFIGLVVWAFSGRRKALFARMARMPLEDDATVESRDRDT